MKKPNVSSNVSLSINQVGKTFQTRIIRIFSNRCSEERELLQDKVTVQNLKGKIIMPN